MHPSTLEILQHFNFILQHFNFNHLPDHLQEVSRPFAALALQIAERGGGPECTASLRHLLEAKDAAVRAVLPGNAAEKVEALRASLPPVHTIRIQYSEAEIQQMLDKELERRGWTVPADPHRRAPTEPDQEG